jgi:RND family efflux transporter MFP subunit
MRSFILSLGSALLPLLLGSCGPHARESHPSAPVLPAQAVRVTVARLAPRSASEEVVGTVRSKLRAILEAKVSGRVAEYRVAPGSTVKAGELLVRLEAQEIQAKVDQALAMRSQAERDFSRQTQLMASNATTRQDYDAADARLKVATAAVKEAEAMMGYAEVAAPFAGVVTRKLADVGDLAMPGKPLLELEAPASLRFEADLPEALVDRVTMGQKMTVKIAALPEPLQVVVSEIAPVADVVSRTFQVKFDLPPAAGLRSGQFGRVSVPVAEISTLRIPAEAVVRRGQLEMLFVRLEGRALMRLVKTGATFPDGVEVLSGLEQGEEVITTHPERLTDGQPETIAAP